MDLVIEWGWRGLVLAVGVMTLADRWPHASAATRYQIGWLALAVVVALPLLHDVPAAPAGVGALSAAAPARGLVSIDHVPSIVIAAGLCAWALWVFQGALRLVLALAALRRVRAACRPFPAALEARLSSWMTHRHRARASRLVLSDDVRGAAVFGLWSPLIAVSPPVAARLTPAELDRIVVHELAHVARRDDWADLAQVVIRMLVGWHPAVWWLDRRLQIEREAAADDWVVALTDEAIPYAASLVKLAELQRAAGRPLRLAPGVLARSQLSARVDRLLDARQNRAIHGSRPVVAAVAAFAIGLGVQLSAIDLVAPPAMAMRARVGAERESSLARIDRDPGAPAQATKPASTLQEASAGIVRGGPGAGALERAPARGDGKADRDADRAPVESGGRLTLTVARTPEPVGNQPADRPVGAPVAATPLVSRMLTALPVPPAPVPIGSSANEPRAPGPTPWGAAADGGVAIGESSRKAAVATAGFFTRLGKSIGGAF